MDELVLRGRVVAALEALRYGDELLLEYRCSERSVAGRVQVYLTGLFPSFNVDVEYNRHGIDPKKVPLRSACRQLVEADRLVIPDIVIHRRGTDQSNLLVIEVKMDDCEPSDLECDRQKLVAIRATFGYVHTLLLQFPSGRESKTRPILGEWDGVQPLTAVV